MARISKEPEIEIEEYEEIVGNWDEASVQEGAADIRAVSIQESTSDEQFDSMTLTERPALRPTERSFAEKKTSRIQWSTNYPQPSLFCLTERWQRFSRAPTAMLFHANCCIKTNRLFMQWNNDTISSFSRNCVRLLEEN